MRPRAVRNGLRWALGASAAVHLLVLAVMLGWPRLLQREMPLPPAPRQEATVDVVMGGGAETAGAPAAPSQPPPAPAPAAEAPPPPPPTPAPAPEPPPAPPPELPTAAGMPPPPPPPSPPEKPSWQSGPLFGEGTVGAAEIIGDRLRPAVGEGGNLPPAYPPVSARLGEQGAVVLKMQIDVTGLVTAVQVLQTSGYSRLDAAAREAVGRWRFAPAQENGQSVPSEQVLTVHFRLN